MNKTPKSSHAGLLGVTHEDGARARVLRYVQLAELQRCWNCYLFYREV